MYCCCFLSVLLLIAGGDSTANNHFGAKLHHDAFLTSPGLDMKNFVLSPYSMFLALSMVLEGAVPGTETWYELLSGLGLPASTTLAELRVANQGDMTSTGSAIFGNGIWVNTKIEDVEMKQSYIDALRDYYQARADSAEFPQPAVDMINEWVSDATRGMIPKLLATLDKDLVSVLINTVYFNSVWLSPFDKSDSRSSQFALINENVFDGTFQVMMMVKEFEGFTGLKYGDHSWGQSLTMPYQQSEEDRPHFRMVLCLPETNSLDSIANLLDAVKSTNGEFLTSVVSEQDFPGAAEDKLKVRVPKFDATTDLLSYKQTLKHLGIDRLFTDTSELYNIANVPVKVGDVLQKAKIIVVEGGTEAAAATVISFFEITSAPPPPPPSGSVREFYAHRPFVFFLQHVDSGTVLFQGHVMEPTKSTRPIATWVRHYFSQGEFEVPSWKKIRAYRG